MTAVQALRHLRAHHTELFVRKIEDQVAMAALSVVRTSPIGRIRLFTSLKFMLSERLRTGEERY